MTTEDGTNGIFTDCVKLEGNACNMVVEWVDWSKKYPDMEDQIFVEVYERECIEGMPLICGTYLTIAQAKELQTFLNRVLK